MFWYDVCNSGMPRVCAGNQRLTGRSIATVGDAPQGLFALRQALADYLGRARGIVADAGQIVIVNGSQQAIDISARLLLKPGDGVVLEEPGYVVARKAFEALGAKLIPARVDANGLNIRVVSSRFPKPKLVYFTPSHQFPTGAVMPANRRFELLDWAEKHNTFLLEDDYDGEFRYLGRPIEAVQSLDKRNRVIYAGTASKTLSPTLRLGFVVAYLREVGAPCVSQAGAAPGLPQLG